MNIPEFIVGMISPYLYKGILDEYEKQEQIQKYKFEPDKQHLINNLHADGMPVHLMPINCVLKCPEVHDMIISGSAGNSENDVTSMNKSGIIVARYSIFYGGASEYSGDSPEKTGFALDFPKSLETVATFLQHKPTLDAIINRDASQIRASLDELNQDLAQPVIATPFLDECLSYRRDRKTCPYW